MPITQDRILNILAALQEYHETLSALRGAIDHALHTAASDEKFREEIWHKMQMIQLNPAARDILIQEREYYRNRAKDNERNKMRMRRKRGYTGTTPDGPINRAELGRQYLKRDLPSPLSPVIPTRPAVYDDDPSLPPAESPVATQADIERLLRQMDDTVKPEDMEL